MQWVFHEAASRGFGRYEWLTTHYSFSFARYYDPNRMGFGLLRVLNDDVIAPGTGFGKHPHDNMEIITIPLSGAIRHEDSMGNSATISVGEVQVMSAGTGVFHAEYNASETEPLSLLQIWIETNKRDVLPRYGQKRFIEEDLRDELCPVVGPIGTTTLDIYQDATLSLGRFEQGRQVQYRLSDITHGLYFFVIEGSVIIEGKQLSSRDGLGVWDIPGGMLTFVTAPKTYLLLIEIPMTEKASSATLEV